MAADDGLIAVLRIFGSARAWRAPARIHETAPHHACLSYAICGEDLVVRQHFKRRIVDQQPGTYVDIGCALPISASNSYLFYTMGWRGICIDANPGLSSKYAAIRPDDVFVASAIAEHEGSCFFYKDKTNLGKSKIWPSADLQEPNLEPAVAIPMRPLKSILAEHLGGRSIQFMNIDVEGTELSVLKSNDWSLYRPEAIMIECHAPTLADRLAMPAIALLTGQGYEATGLIGPNVLMTSK